MKKLITILLIITAIVLVCAQFILPGFLTSKLETKITDSLRPRQQTIEISSSPSAKMITGDIDTFKGNLKDVKLGELNFAEINFHLNNMTLDPLQLATIHEVIVTRIGDGTAEGVVTEADLQEFLKSKIKGIEVQKVDMTSQDISLQGNIDIGGFLSGETRIKGILALKDGVFIFLPQSFSINGLSIGGLTSAVLKEIKIYDFAQFPIPVKAEKVEMEEGRVRVVIRPIAK